MRRLSGLARQAASAERTRLALENYRAMGSDLLTSLQTVATSVVPEVDPMNSYDVRTLLLKGIAGWSYDAAVTPDALDALDAVTAEWAAREVLAFNGPPDEAARKNGSGRSIKH